MTFLQQMWGWFQSGVKRPRFLLGLLLVVVLLVAVVFYRSYQRFLASATSQEAIVTIDRGMSVEQCANRLESEQLISSAFWFRVLARFDQQATIQAGEYRIALGATPGAILEQMRLGKVIQHRFVFPEGATVREVGQLLVEAGWSEAPELLQKPDLLSKLGVQGSSLEGWLFPETYFYRKGDSALSLLTRMAERTRVVLNEEFAKRPEGFGLDPYQTLILASVIEKETGQAEERPIIAAVFHNRLKLGMRLQSDPTVIYGLTEFNGNLTRAHLRAPTPYNSYTQFGLPPTPICNVGRASIHAVLHPTADKYLYFVARGQGRHVFSSTLDEHQRNVRRYQLSNKGSATVGKEPS